MGHRVHRCSLSRQAGVVGIVACIVAGCSRGSPSGPSGTGSPGGSSSQSCRTYAAGITQVTTAGPFVSTLTSACNYNTSTSQGTCNVQYSDNFGGSGSATTVAFFNSRNDFIDEVRVVPPLTRSTSGNTTVTAAGGPFASGTVTNTYDSQNRLTRQVANYTIGSSTITYTAWDSAGRPTLATQIGAGQNNTMNMVYDDNARSLTTTTTSASGVPQTLCTMVYDANGNLLTTTCQGSTAVATITATQTVCR
jgi:hypothetical protein